MDILTLLIILLIVAVCFGGYGIRQNWGPVGWSPVGIVLLILLVLWLTGHAGGLRLRLHEQRRHRRQGGRAQAVSTPNRKRARHRRKKARRRDKRAAFAANVRAVRLAGEALRSRPLAVPGVSVSISRSHAKLASFGSIYGMHSARTDRADALAYAFGRTFDDGTSEVQVKQATLIGRVAEFELTYARPKVVHTIGVDYAKPEPDDGTT